MLSPAYLEIKRLRSSGNATAAYARLSASRPASDDDAFEAAICLFVCGDFASVVNVCQSYAWASAPLRQMAQALMLFLRDGDTAGALQYAWQGIRGGAASNPDAQSLLLILLQANGLSQEADRYVQQHLAPPPVGETLLLTIMAEVAAATEDWRQAYRLASAVVSADPDDFRALLTLSVANYKLNYLHEALGHALRAQLVQPQSQQAILQMMRCYNGLGDYYTALGAFDTLSDEETIDAALSLERGIAYTGLGCQAEAVAALQQAIAGDAPLPAALRALIELHAERGETSQVQALVSRHAATIDSDIECQLSLALERLQHGDIASAAARSEAAFDLSRTQNLALTAVPWPVPEPRLRHDYEQLALLEQRGKLNAAGLDALNLLKRYCNGVGDPHRTFAPPGAEGERLQQALANTHYVPAKAFSGRALGDNDYREIEAHYFAAKPALVVIDNFLSPAALAALRQYSEEATVWKLNYARGYVGALLGQGYNPGVLLQLADELKRAMPRVIGDHALLQAWGFKYDQRLQGINMHADFAKVNVNFWITPDEACTDNTTGGMIVYDLPAPSSWTFADYNTNQAKMKAYLKVHNAHSQRVPYRANRCVLFDSSLIHITDALHFKPGYENRRVNVTLLYGRARSQG